MWSQKVSYRVNCNSKIDAISIRLIKSFEHSAYVSNPINKSTLIWMRSKY